MSDFTKAERKTLRELAGRVYEAEAHLVLGKLESEFARWRAGEIESTDLFDVIHKFHQGPAREIWSRHQSLKDPETVARGVAWQLIDAADVPDGLAQKLAPLVQFFAQHKQ